MVRREQIHGENGRALLVEWLSAIPETSESKLGSYLNGQKNVEVFFVSTEGLENESLGPGKLPKPHGIARFVNWCLSGASGVGD